MINFQIQVPAPKKALNETHFMIGYFGLVQLYSREAQQFAGSKLKQAQLNMRIDFKGFTDLGALIPTRAVLADLGALIPTRAVLEQSRQQWYNLQ